MTTPNAPVQIQNLGVQQPSETMVPALAPSQRMSQSGSGYSAVVVLLDVVVDIEAVVVVVVEVVVGIVVVVVVEVVGFSGLQQKSSFSWQSAPVRSTGSHSPTALQNFSSSPH